MSARIGVRGTDRFRLEIVFTTETRRPHGDCTENSRNFVGVLLTNSFSPCGLRVLRVSVVKP